MLTGYPVWVVAGLYAVSAAALMGMLFWLLLREPHRRDEPGERRSVGRAVAPVLWHVVEEFLPPLGDQPGRWVEIARDVDSGKAVGVWSRLVADNDADPEPYRIVSTATPPPLRRTGRPVGHAPAPRFPVPTPRAAPLEPSPAPPFGPSRAAGTAGTGSPPSLFSPRQESPAVTFTADAPEDTPLYERLVHFARTDGVFALVSERLYARILGPRGTDPNMTGDPYLVPFFRDRDGSLIDRDRLERHMTHFLMAAFGGPKRYTGRGMANAHAGRYITGEAFDRVIGHVVAVLTDLSVPADWIAEVGATVEPLRASIVTAAPAR